MIRLRPLLPAILFALAVCLPAPAPLLCQQTDASPIRFDLTLLPFRLNSNESQSRNAPESMAGGIAVFDYNGDGRPDIFFTNGADLATMKKTGPQYWNRLYRND